MATGCVAQLPWPTKCLVCTPKGGGILTSHLGWFHCIVGRESGNLVHPFMRDKASGYVQRVIVIPTTYTRSIESLHFDIHSNDRAEITSCQHTLQTFAILSNGHLHWSAQGSKMAARQGTVQKIMAQVLYLVGKTSMAPDTPCCPQNGREESRVVWEGVTPSRAHSEPPVPATRVPTPPRRGQEQWSLYEEGGVWQNRTGGGGW